MSLIQNGLLAVASYDKSTEEITTKMPLLRYADKGEVVASMANTVITEKLAKANVTGVTQGLTRVTERSTKSKAQVMHHNCRVSFKMPTVNATTTEGSGKVAVNKMEESTVSVSFATPVRVSMNTEYTDALGKAIKAQLYALGDAYESGLVDLLVEA